MENLVNSELTTVKLSHEFIHESGLDEAIVSLYKSSEDSNYIYFKFSNSVDNVKFRNVQEAVAQGLFDLSFRMPAAIEKSLADVLGQSSNVLATLEVFVNDLTESLSSLKVRADFTKKILLFVSKFTKCYLSNWNPSIIVLEILEFLAQCNVDMTKITDNFVGVVTEAVGNLFEKRAQGSFGANEISAFSSIAFILLSALITAKIPNTSGMKGVLTSLNLLGRAAIGFNGLFPIIREAIQKLMSHILSEEYGIPTHIQEAEKAVDGLREMYSEVQKLLKDSPDVIMEDYERSSKVVNLHSEFLEKIALLERYKTDRSIIFGLYNHFAPLTTLYSKIDLSRLTDTQYRTEPLLIYLYGRPGVGKSGVAYPLAIELLKEEVDGIADDWINQIYFRNALQEFWDGYKKHLICIYDDAFQRTDTPGNPNPEFIEVIKSQNIAPWGLHMARIADKEKTQFVSKAIILTANRKRYTTPSLTDPGAWERRLEIVANTLIRPEFGKTMKTSDGKIYTALDTDKVEQLIGDKMSLEPYIFEVTIRRKHLGYMNFAAFAKLCREEYTKKKNWSAGFHSYLEKQAKTKISQQPQTFNVFPPPPFVNSNGIITTPPPTINVIPSPSTTPINSIGTAQGWLNWGKLEKEEDCIEQIEVKEDIWIEIKEKIYQWKDNPWVKLTSVLLTSIGLIYLIYSFVSKDRPGKDLVPLIKKNLVCDKCGIIISSNELYKKHRKVCGTPQNEKEIRDQYMKAMELAILDHRLKNLSNSESRKEQPLSFSESRKENINSFVESRKENSVSYSESRKEQLPSYSESCKETIDSCTESRKENVVSYSESRKEALNSFSESRKEATLSLSESVKLDSHLENLHPIVDDESDGISELFIEKPNDTLQSVFRNVNLALVEMDNSINRTLLDLELDNNYEKIEQNDIEPPKTLFEQLVDKFSESLLEKDKQKYGICEAMRNINTEQCVNNKIFNNALRINFVYEGEVFGQMNLLMIKGQVGLTVAHALPYLKKSQEVIIQGSHIDFTFRIPVIDLQYTRFQEDIDALLLILPSSVPCFPDLTRLFWSESESRKWNEFKINLLTKRYMKSRNQFILTPLIVESECADCILAEDGTKYRDDMSQVTIYIKRYLKYMVNTASGDCGAPIIIHDSDHPPRLAGIHSFGSASGNGGPCLTRELIEEKLRIIPQKAQIKFDWNCHRPQQIIPKGNFFPIGNLKKPEVIMRKTAIRKSAAYGIFGEPDTCPAQLLPTKIGGELVDPLFKGISKWGTKTYHLPLALYNETLESLKQRIGKHGDNKMNTILRYEEAIRGIDGQDYFDSMNRQSSPGFIWRDISKGIPGKHKWLGQDEYFDVQNMELKRIVRERLQYARRGERYPTFWIDTLKDERRDKEKVSQAKTRVFSAGQIDFIVAWRMFFQSFDAMLRRNRIFVGSCVGINPFSEDWKVLALFLKQNSNLVAGDYSNFDGRTLRQCVHMYIDLANWWYDDNSEQQLIRYTLGQEILNAVHVVDDIMYMVYGGNPSGQPSTADTNGIVGMANMRIAWRQVFRTPYTTMNQYDYDNESQKHVLKPRDLSWFKDPGHKYEFNTHVYDVHYGDDHICSIDHLISDFNQDTIPGVMERFGQIYTDETKGRVVQKCSRALDEVEFLKRQFILDEDGQWRAPLSKKTIEDILNWIKTRNNVTEVMMMQADAVFKEASLHGREYFNDVVDKVQRKFRTLGKWHPPNRGYEFYRDSDMPYF